MKLEHWIRSIILLSLAFLTINGAWGCGQNTADPAVVESGSGGGGGVMSGDGSGGGGGSLRLAAKTWVPLAAPAMGAGPYQTASGKHARMTYDSKRQRLVLSGGDYQHPSMSVVGNGSQMVWSVNLTTGQWTMLGAWCNGPLMPGRPDTVGWTYDSKRDRGVMLPGFYFVDQGGLSSCSGVQETGDAVTFDFTTNKWSAATWAPPSGGYGGDCCGVSYASYDPGTDAVYRFRYNSGRIEKLSLANNRWTSTAFAGLEQSDFNRAQSAVDVPGRALYVIDAKGKRLVKYSLDRPGVSYAPMPSQYKGPSDRATFETYLVFDSVNRVLLMPDVADFDGIVVGLGVYHVDSRKWEYHAVPAGPSGNVWQFDPAANAMLGVGRNAEHKFWLYRYGP